MVLKITADGQAAKGLHKAMEVSKVAQQKLGVTCTDTAAEDVVVHHRVRVSCANGAGDEVLKVSANEKAFKGLRIAVKAFMRKASPRLGLTCEVA